MYGKNSCCSLTQDDGALSGTEHRRQDIVDLLVRQVRPPPSPYSTLANSSSSSPAAQARSRNPLNNRMWHVLMYWKWINIKRLVDTADSKILLAGVVVLLVSVVQPWTTRPPPRLHQHVSWFWFVRSNLISKPAWGFCYWPDGMCYVGPKEKVMHQGEFLWRK